MSQSPMPPLSTGALAGLLVVDFSRVLAGPFATMMLADLGARVVKIERPDGGDDSRHYGPFAGDRSLYFARVNRGKQSVALDLKSAADLQVAHDLAARADVVVENFRPGVMDRLGLGAAQLRAAHPGLVYCSVSGFGHTGPWSLRPAYDAVVQGMSGLMTITGEPGGLPVKPGMPIADLSAGLYAFGGIVAALHGRGRTGRGTHLDLALFDATVSLLEGPALAWLANGREPVAIGNAHSSIAPFDTFQCADREITICAANDALFGTLATALGAPRLPADPRYVSNALRHQSRDELKVEIESLLAIGTAEHWLTRLDLVGVPCGPISTVGEAVGSAQSGVRRMVIDAGGLRMPGNPLKLSGYDDPLVRDPAPGLDEQGAAIRAEFAPTAAVSLDLLVQQFAVQWTHATEHPFLAGVRDDSLPVAALECWLAQDYRFVADLLRFQARLLARAPRPAQAVLAGGVSSLVSELAWFEELAVARGLDLGAPPLPHTLAYAAVLDRLDADPYGVGVVALWVLERSYLLAWSWASPAAAAHRELVEHWTTPEFAAYVSSLAALADAALADDALAAGAAGRLSEAVSGVLNQERAFWDMALEAAPSDPRADKAGPGA